MSKTADQYLAGMTEPVRKTLQSGYVFQFREMTPVHWGEIFQGLPTFEVGDQKSPNIGRVAELHKRIHERLIDGVVDEETGEVTTVPYERMRQLDLSEVADLILSGGPFNEDAAAQARRSLPIT